MEEKILLPGHLQTFPPCARISEEPWGTIAKDGLVVCPDDCGAWTGRVVWDDVHQLYMLTFGGTSSTPGVKPFVLRSEVEAALLTETLKIGGATTRISVLERLLALP